MNATITLFGDGDGVRTTDDLTLFELPPLPASGTLLLQTDTLALDEGGVAQRFLQARAVDTTDLSSPFVTVMVPATMILVPSFEVQDHDGTFAEGNPAADRRT